MKRLGPCDKAHEVRVPGAQSLLESRALLFLALAWPCLCCPHPHLRAHLCAPTRTCVPPPAHVCPHRT